MSRIKQTTLSLSLSDLLQFRHRSPSHDTSSGETLKHLFCLYSGQRRRAIDDLCDLSLLSQNLRSLSFYLWFSAMHKGQKISVNLFPFSLFCIFSFHFSVVQTNTNTNCTHCTNTQRSPDERKCNVWHRCAKTVIFQINVFIDKLCVCVCVCVCVYFMTAYYLWTPVGPFLHLN